MSDQLCGATTACPLWLGLSLILFALRQARIAPEGGTSTDTGPRIATEASLATWELNGPRSIVQLKGGESYTVESDGRISAGGANVRPNMVLAGAAGRWIGPVNAPGQIIQGRYVVIDYQGPPNKRMGLLGDGQFSPSSVVESIIPLS